MKLSYRPENDSEVELGNTEYINTNHASSRRVIPITRQVDARRFCVLNSKSNGIKLEPRRLQRQHQRSDLANWRSQFKNTLESLLDFQFILSGEKIRENLSIRANIPEIIPSTVSTL